MTTEASSQPRLKMGAVEQSILDYVLNFHAPEINRSRAALMALLCHAGLLSRGAKLVAAEDSVTPLNSETILPQGWSSQDLIRLSYRLVRPLPGLSGTSSTRENLLQVSIVESETHVYVSLTDSTTNKFGHAEFSGPEHVRLDSLAPSTSTAETKNKRDVVDLSAVFPQLDTTLYEMEEKLWNVVLPAPSAPSSRVAAEVDRTVRVSPLRNDRPVEPFGYGQRNVPIPTVPAFPEYGRSDLDPFGGLGTGSDLRPGGVGGMLLDPNRNMPGMPLHRFVDPQLPPGSVPPGARFDPIGPPMVPGRGLPRGGRFAPDPDHAMPPGFEDMYM